VPVYINDERRHARERLLNEKARQSWIRTTGFERRVTWGARRSDFELAASGGHRSLKCRGFSCDKGANGADFSDGGNGCRLSTMGLASVEVENSRRERGMALWLCFEERRAFHGGSFFFLANPRQVPSSCAADVSRRER